MRYFLLAALMLTSLTANATPYLVYNYTENVRVVISNETCLITNLKGNRAAVQTVTGKFVQGCWYFVDEHKHVRIDWNNPGLKNDFAVIPFSEFKVVDESK